MLKKIFFFFLRNSFHISHSNSTHSHFFLTKGRARPSIASLYNWRYKDLKDLPITHTPEYHLANPGLKFDYQVVNVEDYEGKGESTPTPFFYQNLGEAEYAVALYMYMRLLGYEISWKISLCVDFYCFCFFIW